MNTYVEVPAAEIFAALEAAGFKKEAGWGEVTYGRAHTHDPRLKVKVYTSVAPGEPVARAKDADAIRVIGVFEWFNSEHQQHRVKVLRKAKVLRVTSVEGVVTRTIEAARDCYRALNDYRREFLIRDVP